jgi:hypothetical protein
MTIFVVVIVVVVVDFTLIKLNYNLKDNDLA